MGLLDFISPGKKNRQQTAMSTQTHLRVGEVRDNVLVLKNGGLRTILKVSSINFNLKSEQEQNAIIYGYQGFLNSLEFPIQILVRSKKLNIDSYIDQVEALAEKQENPLLKEQTEEYAQYVKKLVDYADIMEKEFYVVVPFDPGRVQSQFGVQKFFERLAPKDSYADIKRRRKEFNQLKKGLAQRVNIVKTGLENCGLKVKELKTMEIVELLYNAYNPLTSRSSKLKDTEEISVLSDEEKLEEEGEKTPTTDLQ